MSNPCPVCLDTTASVALKDFGHRISVRCPRCGQFTVTESFVEQLQLPSDERHRSRVSCWLRGQSDIGVRPTLTAESVQQFRLQTDPPISERIVSLLKALDRTTLRIGTSVSLSSDMIARCHCIDLQDLMGLAQVADQAGFVQARSSQEVRITNAGYAKLEAEQSARSSSSIGFVAMSFRRDLETAYVDGIESAIRNSGWEALRIDRIEHTNKIDDEIVAAIRRCRFMVADFTYQRPNVYYEAGLAHGLGKPVFVTCREAEGDEPLHFDTRQYNCIFWTEPSGLREKLGNRIEAVLGRGPLTISPTP
jgi:nucleoside 2-deoxyribosyltransferase